MSEEYKAELFNWEKHLSLKYQKSEINSSPKNLIADCTSLACKSFGIPKSELPAGDVKKDA